MQFAYPQDLLDFSKWKSLKTESNRKGKQNSNLKHRDRTLDWTRLWDIRTLTQCYTDLAIRNTFETTSVAYPLPNLNNYWQKILWKHSLAPWQGSVLLLPVKNILKAFDRRITRISRDQQQSSYASYEKTLASIVGFRTWTGHRSTQGYQWVSMSTDSYLVGKSDLTNSKGLTVTLWA